MDKNKKTRKSSKKNPGDSEKNLVRFELPNDPTDEELQEFVDMLKSLAQKSNPEQAKKGDEQANPPGSA